MSASFWLIDNDFLANMGTLPSMEKQYFILQAYEQKLERKVDTTITLFLPPSQTHLFAGRCEITLPDMIFLPPWHRHVDLGNPISTPFLLFPFSGPELLLSDVILFINYELLSRKLGGLGLAVLQPHFPLTVAWFDR